MKPLKMVRSQAQEKRVAKSLSGGKRQAQSGAGPWAKNDVKSDRFLVECKTTDNRKQITLLLRDLRDLEFHAALEGKEPIMDLEIAGNNYRLVPEWVWDLL